MHFALKKITTGLAASAAAFALAVTGSAIPALAETTFDTQTYTTTWDEVPTYLDLEKTASGKTLMVTGNHVGDPQVGQTETLVVTSSGTDAAKLDSSSVIVSDLYSISRAKIKEVSDGNLLLVYRGMKIVRYKSVVVLGFSVSTDDGATWSAPAKLPDSALESSLEYLDFEIQSLSDGTALILVGSDGSRYVGYFRTPSLAEPNWTAVVAGENNDYGRTTDSFSSGTSLWIEDKLVNLNSKSTSKSQAIYENTYSGYEATPSLQSMTKVLSVKTKTGATMTAANDNGDRIAAIIYPDTKKKKLKLTYKIFNVETQTWSAAITKTLGSSKKVSYWGAQIWLANDLSFSFNYDLITRSYRYQTWFRTVDTSGAVSAAINGDSVSGPSWIRSDYFSKYLGGGEFAYVYWEQYENYLGEQYSQLKIQRGPLATIETISIDRDESNLPAFWNDQTEGCFIESNTRQGLEQGTEESNTIQIECFKLARSVQ